MTIIEAILLGIVQGLTEFLPISSSGHLELMNYIFDVKHSNSLQFTVAVHTATVLSTIVVFREEILKIIKGLFKFQMNDQTMFAFNVAVSMIPIAIVGLFFKDDVEALFTSNLLLIGSMLLLTALLLTFSHYYKSSIKPMTPQRAFLIGLAQACAVLPGLSRSGSTISTGLILGIGKDEVAKFSFLMVLVPILGASFLEAISIESTDTIATTPIIAGFIAAFLAGLIACRFMIRIIKQGKLIWFAIYCALVGTVSIISYFI